ncbi:exostosin-2-like [Stylophora pistillata]|uniref:exostosin-2-like n=1 Tax=Stylophora pistillata TaxID=50429 RepID=UPI000C0576A5|nr:exostosin-2-like [Stylophora pistillata]
MRMHTRSVILVGILCSLLFIFFSLELWPLLFADDESEVNSPLVDKDVSEIRLRIGSPLPDKRDSKCLMHNCFDIFQCKVNENKLMSVYVYPYTRFLDEDGKAINKPMSREFYELLSTIEESKYYTPDIKKACIIIPSIDTLNQKGLDLRWTARSLAELPSWSDRGKNHLLFNMLPGSAPEYNSTLDVATDKAILAGAGFATWSYRIGYDVSIPVFNPLTNKKVVLPQKRSSDWLFVSSQTNMNHLFRSQLEEVERDNSRFLILNHCPRDPNNVHKRCKGSETYQYPDILQHATFCLVIRGVRLGQTTLLDALMMGCIPVVIGDDYILPFSDVLDWKRGAVHVVEKEINRIPAILREISSSQIEDMRRQTHRIIATWEKCFGLTNKPFSSTNELFSIIEIVREQGIRRLLEGSEIQPLVISQFLIIISIIIIVIPLSNSTLFIAQYFSHLFTYMMPVYIRDWVDKHMNCEDIAMNFMVSNYTGKAPIKVTPRKRFRCPECVTESLWADPSHFVERSECLNEFVRAYGVMPLQTVEFRADPVLFGEDLPAKLKLYNHVGSI